MQLGSWWIAPYTLRIVIAAIGALAWVAWHRARYDITRQELLRWLWRLLLFVLVCARIGYGLGNLSYFASQPFALIQLNNHGGLHGGSAWLGGMIGIWLWAWRSRRRFRDLASLVTPAALLLAVGAWWGCADVGCAWGKEIFQAPWGQQWMIIEAPDLYRTITSRYAVQLLGGSLALLLTGIAVLLGPRGGSVLSIYLLGEAGLTLLRADPVPRLGSWRIDTVLTLILAIGWARLWLGGNYSKNNLGVRANGKTTL